MAGVSPELAALLFGVAFILGGWALALLESARRLERCQCRMCQARARGAWRWGWAWPIIAFDLIIRHRNSPLKPGPE